MIRIRSEEKRGKEFTRAPDISLLSKKSFPERKEKKRKEKKRKRNEISQKILLSSDEIPEVEERVPPPPLGDEGAEQ